MLTAVLLVEGVNPEEIAASLREIAKDIDEGVTNCRGGYGPSDHLADFQINVGGLMASLTRMLIQHYKAHPCHIYMG
jgi:hypothetical protein